MNYNYPNLALDIAEYILERYVESKGIDPYEYFFSKRKEVAVTTRRIVLDDPTAEALTNIEPSPVPFSSWFFEEVSKDSFLGFDQLQEHLNTMALTEDRVWFLKIYSEEDGLWVGNIRDQDGLWYTTTGESAQEVIQNIDDWISDDGEDMYVDGYDDL